MQKRTLDLTLKTIVDKANRTSQQPTICTAVRWLRFSSIRLLQDYNTDLIYLFIYLSTYLYLSIYLPRWDIRWYICHGKLQILSLVKNQLKGRAPFFFLHWPVWRICIWMTTTWLVSFLVVLYLFLKSHVLCSRYPNRERKPLPIYMICMIAYMID